MSQGASQGDANYDNSTAVQQLRRGTFIVFRRSIEHPNRASTKEKQIRL